MCATDRAARADAIHQLLQRRTVGDAGQLAQDHHGEKRLARADVEVAPGHQLACVTRELLLLAQRDGIDPRLAAEVMAQSSIGSPMLKARVPLVLDLPDEAWFDVSLMHKDIRLALVAARERGVPLPSAGVADDMLTRAAELGYEHRDIAALYEVLARMNPAIADTV